MKTIFMGTPEFSIKSLEIVNKITDLQAIFTKIDKVNTRGNKIDYSPVKKYGLDNNIEIIQPNSLKNDEIINKIKDINPDLIIVVAYGKIIPREIIDIPKFGIINVHASLLPKYRGASPINAAIINGDKETGVSIMYIEEELDSGDVILEKKCDILEEDNLKSIHDKLSQLGAEGLEEAISLIESNKVNAIRQDHSLATFVKPIKKEDMKINWNKTKEEIFNFTRGLDPFPGAYTTLNDKIIKIYRVEKLEINSNYDGNYGEIVDVDKDRGPIVKVKDGLIVITKAKIEGKNTQIGRDIVNGRQIKKGDLLS